MSRPLLRLNDGREDTSPDLKDTVKELQRLLTQDGYAVDSDGIFGPGTEDAVKRFQREHNLDDDGTAGPLTWAALLGTAPPDLAATFTTTYPQNNPSLTAQLAEAAQYRDFIAQGAGDRGFPLCVIAGLGSRESGWGLALKPVGPAGTGDFAKRRFPTALRGGPLPPDNGGYGRGLMQIDYDAQEFARTGNWQGPQANILKGCEILAGSRDFIKRKTSLAGNDLLRAALAGYNCGPGNILKTVQNNLDVDFYTAGRNYSSDVLNRAGWFQLHGWE